jgi:hypothetical protein
MARLTRRELAALVAVAPLAAQSVPASTQPQPISAPSTLEAATKQVQQAGEQLRALAVPMSVEPAFKFRV